MDISKVDTENKGKSKKALAEVEPNENNVIYQFHEEMFGKEFINSKQEALDFNEVFKVPLICLFFSGQWCNPSNIFTKELIEVYNEANQGIKTIEIIQVTLEKDFLPGESQDKINEIRKEEDSKFKSYILDKPWVFLNYLDERNNKLRERFNISSIPKFIVFRRDLSFLTENGRNEISKEGYNISEKWLKQLNNSE